MRTAVHEADNENDSDILDIYIYIFVCVCRLLFFDLHLILIRWWEHLQLIEKTGFWGIFMLASWPNAFFDLCGICCGYERDFLHTEHPFRQ